VEWLAFINREFPGSGITVWNVYDLQAHWWGYWVRVASSMPRR
jgi:hypothetical protein